MLLAGTWWLPPGLGKDIPRLGFLSFSKQAGQPVSELNIPGELKKGKSQPLRLVVLVLHPALTEDVSGEETRAHRCSPGLSRVSVHGAQPARTPTGNWQVVMSDLIQLAEDGGNKVAIKRGRGVRLLLRG